MSEASGQPHSPLTQFEVNNITDFPPIMGMDINYTNSSLFMTLAVISVALFFGFAMRRKAMVPGRLQSVAEVLYGFIAETLKDTVGNDGKKYFPFIFTLFLFILACNLWGMMPYSFTVTSHIAVTFALALFIMIAITIIGFVNHGFKFLGLFLPSGTPLPLAPLLIVIEIFSYLARPFSLSIRLAANMMAGHTMLKLMGGFVISLGWLFGWAPLGFLIVLSGFEVFVAVLQAYIFTILTCVYLNDAVHLH